MEIRRLAPRQWRELRDVRLRALAEAPHAFSTTHAEALRRADAWWVDAAARAQGGGRAYFLARASERAVGMAGAIRNEGCVEVVQMWADPGWRRRGVAQALLDAVRAFAGGGELRLGVAPDNAAARRAYEAYGFAETGAMLPRTHPWDPPAREMRLPAEPRR